MSTDINRWRAGMILLFVIVFTVVGWSAPIVFATHIPQSEVIEMHSFQAQNATPDATTHFIYMDRVVHHPAAAETFTELYMVSESGERIELHTNERRAYFQEGHDEIVVPMELPNSTIEGTYRYVLVAKFEMADGRVERTFTFESEKFVIEEGTNMTDDPKEFAEECARPPHHQ